MDIVFRASVMFEIVYALLRLLDKRELAEVAPFELDLLVAVGDLIQQRVTHNEFSTIRAILANSTFAFWALVLNDLAFRPRRAETLIGGKPSMLTREGTVMPG
ncbi:MAG: DUF421 domain-containing protein, partial [Alphaproteobacteria bacterium]|nr:DUF421 domain-containing protein [Alphaproteobacteria bacterium]